MCPLPERLGKQEMSAKVSWSGSFQWLMQVAAHIVSQSMVNEFRFGWVRDFSYASLAADPRVMQLVLRLSF